MKRAEAENETDIDTLGFPGGSAGKESACNPEDPGLIPGWGIQLFSILVAQMIKKPLAMRETWVRSLGREDPLEEGMATHSSILAWRIPRTAEPGGLQSMEFSRQEYWSG